MKSIAEDENEMAGQKAADYFGNGFHCAEAVAAAVLEVLGEDASEAAAHATAFGGGFGRTHQEACGALSGALIAIGHLHGRRKPGDAWELPATLAAKIRQRFLNDFGTTHCATLRNRFGEERQASECQKLTGHVATTLLELLTEKEVQYEANEAQSWTEKNSGCKETKSKNLMICFVGDPGRGQRLQEAVKPYGWEIFIETEMGRESRINLNPMTNLVILDDFPDSKIARSAYYQLQHSGSVRFLALNDSPNALKYSRVNALSFIKIIDRDPELNELINAIGELVGSNRKLLSRQPETIDLEKKPYWPKFIRPCDVQGKACC